MTSNLGTGPRAQGQRSASRTDDAEASYERDEGPRSTRSLKTHFRPEFLNRIDETIVFHELVPPRGACEMVDHA